jgi:hypothetical protein
MEQRLLGERANRRHFGTRSILIGAVPNFMLQARPRP